MKPGGVYLINGTSIELAAIYMGEVKSDAVGQRWWYKSDVFTDPASYGDIQGSAILLGKNTKNEQQRKNEMRCLFPSHLNRRRRAMQMCSD